jgi:hypothetical protein
VAGRTIGNPLVAVTGYLKEHPGTVRHYDFIAGTSGEVTAELVKATRMPWMASRISTSQEAWSLAGVAAGCASGGSGAQRRVAMVSGQPGHAVCRAQ